MAEKPIKTSNFDDLEPGQLTTAQRLQIVAGLLLLLERYVADGKLRIGPSQLDFDADNCIERIVFTPHEAIEVSKSAVADAIEELDPSGTDQSMRRR
jgi:hypothetical protein